MKKAVIATGGKQYIVSEGETVIIESLKSNDKQVSFEALLVVDGDSTQVGTPFVKGVSVTAEVTNSEGRAEKVTAIRYKAKKRVRKVRGHRQHQTEIKITKIA